MLAQQVVAHQPSASLLQQLTPLASPVAAILGVFAGTFLQSRAHRDETDRAASIEAYTRFLLRCGDCSLAAVEMLNGEVGSEESRHDRLWASVFPLREAASEMRVLNAMPVAECADSVLAAAMELCDSLSTGTGVDEARAAWRGSGAWLPLQHFEQTRITFETVIRNDLHGRR
jgi:hypothetical protein